MDGVRCGSRAYYFSAGGFSIVSSVGRSESGGFGVRSGEIDPFRKRTCPPVAFDNLGHWRTSALSKRIALSSLKRVSRSGHIVDFEIVPGVDEGKACGVVV